MNQQVNLKPFLEATRDYVLSGLIVRKNGQVVAQWGDTEQTRNPQYSVSKSLLGMMAGLIWQDGGFELDELIQDRLRGLAEIHAPELAPVELDDLCKAWRKVTYRHLLSMSDGQQKPSMLRRHRADFENIKNWFLYAFKRHPVIEPGVRFMYTNSTPHLLGYLLEDIIGCHLLTYAQNRIFTPLGIDDVVWPSDPEGHLFPGTGCLLSVEELSRIADSCLFGGRDLDAPLSREWLNEMTRTQIETGFSDPAMRQYGLLTWVGPLDGYRFWGVRSQLAFILPSLCTSICLNADDARDKEVIHLVEKYLIPEC